MAEYLVGMTYHEPEPFALWKKGLVEDYESSTGIFIDAESADEAVAWGEKIAEALLRRVNNDPTLDWKSFHYNCWIEDNLAGGSWSHCFEFFQHVKVGQMPVLERMGTEAYKRWSTNAAN